MTDVTVFGAGVFGLGVAWACLRRGAGVRVVDPGGVGAGASGGIVGALAPHTPENWNAKKAFQLDSLLMADDWWGAVAEAGGTSPGYGRTGRVQPVADERALALARAREGQAAELWRGLATWQLARADPDAGWAPRSPTGWMIHDTLSARLHPRQACAALAAAVTAGGGVIAPDAAPAPAHGVQVWATGAAGLTRLGADLGRSVGAGIKGQAALLAFDRREAPQIFADGLHVVPHADGTVAIGSTTERDFADPTATDGQLDALIARVRIAVPALAGASVIARWAGLRPRASSRAPILGAHPVRPGVFIANGGFKIGFGMAPKVAEVMADLVLEGRDTIPDGFRVADSL